MEKLATKGKLISKRSEAVVRDTYKVRIISVRATFGIKNGQEK